MSYKPLLLLVSIIVMILVITMSGCVNNGQTPPITPTPTPTTIPVPSTTTPTPTPIPTPIPTSTPSPVPVDTIVGLWETYARSTYASIEFFENGTLNYTEEIYSLKGIWSKIDDRHYVINVGKGGDMLIILNDKLTWFNINGTELNYVKT